MLFDDDETGSVAIDRAALKQMREELRTIGACAASMMERTQQLGTEIDKLLGIATPVASSPAGKKPHLPRLMLTRFDQEFQKKFNGESAPIVWAKDTAIMKRLVDQRGVEKVEELIVAFFESEDPFIANSGYTVGAFQSQIGKLIVSRNSPAKVHGFTPKTVHNGQSAAAGAALIRRSFNRS